MRDSSFQKLFVGKLAGLSTLCSELERQTDSYFDQGSDPNIGKILREMTSKASITHPSDNEPICILYFSIYIYIR